MMLLEPLDLVLFLKVLKCFLKVPKSCFLKVPKSCTSKLNSKMIDSAWVGHTQAIFPMGSIHNRMSDSIPGGWFWGRGNILGQTNLLSKFPN